MPDRSELNVDCGRLESSRWASARWSSTAARGEEAALSRSESRIAEQSRSRPTCSAWLQEIASFGRRS